MDRLTKTSIKIKGELTASLFAAALPFIAHAATTQADCTAYMETSDTHYNNSSFTHGGHWSDKAIPGEGSTNYVGAGFTLMDPYLSGGSNNYPGDVLVLAGEFVGNSSGMCLISWPELRLENGALYRWSSFSQLGGKVVVESGASAPATFRMFYPGGYNGANFMASFQGASDSCFILARNAGTPSVELPDLAWRMYGDWSEFYGTCVVSNRSQFVPCVASATYPGTIVIDEGGYWWGYYNFGSAVTTVGTLDLRDGSHYWGKCSAAGSSSITVVTNELRLGATEIRFMDLWTASAKTVSTMPNYTVGGNPVKIPVFKLIGAAAERVPDLTRATIPDYTESKRSGEFPRLKALVCEDNADGSKTIYAKYYDADGIIRMKKGNGSWNPDQSAFSPNINPSDYWSTGEIPTSETVGDVYAQYSILWSGYNTTYSYPNLTYTIAPGYVLYMQCDNLTAKKFIFGAGASINTYSQNRVKHMYGPIELPSPHSTNSISVFQNFDLTIHGDISGASDLRITNPSPHSSPVGYTTFKGSHAGLHGTFRVTCAANSSTDGGKVLMPDLANGKYTHVTIERGDQFGGRYDGTTPWKSIWINCYGCIHMNAADIMVDEPTRGLFVDGGAQFDVGEGRTCALNIPVTYGGELLKRGAGTLSLGGDARFIDGDPATEPQEGTNRLTIVAGSLAVTSTNAVNGVRVAFAEGTSMILDPSPASTAMAEFGMVNTRWTEPFVSTAADGKINVAVKASEALESGAQRVAVALCTVANGTLAEELRAKFKIRKPAHYRVNTETRTNADGTVTLLAVFSIKGFSLSVQ